MYILIPTSRSYIYNITDNNNNSQSIDYVGEVLNINDSIFGTNRIRYNLFKTSIATTTTDHTYTFKL